jgi:hypothetical protein
VAAGQATHVSIEAGRVVELHEVLR